MECNESPCSGMLWLHVINLNLQHPGPRAGPQGPGLAPRGLGWPGTKQGNQLPHCIQLERMLHSRCLNYCQSQDRDLDASQMPVLLILEAYCPRPGGLLQLEHLHWLLIRRPGPRSFPHFDEFGNIRMRCPQETGAQLQAILTLSCWALSGKCLLVRRWPHQSWIRRCRIRRHQPLYFT